jgi:hypothetical protein
MQRLLAQEHPLAPLFASGSPKKSSDLHAFRAGETGRNTFLISSDN